MITLSNNAEKLLRKISRVETISADKTNKFNRDVIESLLKSDCITGEVSCIDLSSGSLEYSHYSITETGKAYLDSAKSTKIRFWVPMILSIISLILSGLSIILSPYFSAYFSHVWGL